MSLEIIHSVKELYSPSAKETTQVYSELQQSKRTVLVDDDYRVCQNVDKCPRRRHNSRESAILTLITLPNRLQAFEICCALPVLAWKCFWVHKMFLKGAITGYKEGTNVHFEFVEGNWVHFLKAQLFELTDLQRVDWFPFWIFCWVPPYVYMLSMIWKSWVQCYNREMEV